MMNLVDSIKIEPDAASPASSVSLTENDAPCCDPVKEILAPGSSYMADLDDCDQSRFCSDIATHNTNDRDGKQLHKLSQRLYCAVVKLQRLKDIEDLSDANYLSSRMHVEGTEECQVKLKKCKKSYMARSSKKDRSQAGAPEQHKNEVTESSQTDGSLLCILCGSAFRNRDGIRQHERRVHNRTGIKKKLDISEIQFTCSHCGKIFLTKVGLQDHERIHIGEKTLSCPICDVKFITVAARAHHIHRHKTGITMRCLKCEINFDSHRSLLDHNDSVHDQNKNGDGQSSIHKRHQCSMCVASFRSSDSLNKHRKSFHGKRGKASHRTCIYCKVVLATTEERKEHELSHAVNGQVKIEQLGMYTCYLCNKVYTARQALVNHVVALHNTDNNDLTRFRCGICGLKCATRSAQQYHMRTNHSKSTFHAVLPFSCSQCDKLFSRKANLQTHELTHRQERRERTKSTNETEDQSLNCSHCKKQFNKKWNLKVHELTHENKKKRLAKKYNVKTLDIPVEQMEAVIDFKEHQPWIVSENNQHVQTQAKKKWEPNLLQSYANDGRDWQQQSIVEQNVAVASIQQSELLPVQLQQAVAETSKRSQFESDVLGNGPLQQNTTPVRTVMMQSGYTGSGINQVVMKSINLCYNDVDDYNSDDDGYDDHADQPVSDYDGPTYTAHPDKSFTCTNSHDDHEIPLQHKGPIISGPAVTDSFKSKMPDSKSYCRENVYSIIAQTLPSYERLQQDATFTGSRSLENTTSINNVICRVPAEHDDSRMLEKLSLDHESVGFRRNKVKKKRCLQRTIHTAANNAKNTQVNTISKTVPKTCDLAKAKGNFKCKVCKKEFNRKTQLDLHARVRLH